MTAAGSPHPRESGGGSRGDSIPLVPTIPRRRSPVTPEVAGSSPVAPVEIINGTTSHTFAALSRREAKQLSRELRNALKEKNGAKE
jgi:hypothetical protein